MAPINTISSQTQTHAKPYICSRCKREEDEDEKPSINETKKKPEEDREYESDWMVIFKLLTAVFVGQVICAAYGLFLSLIFTIFKKIFRSNVWNFVKKNMIKIDTSVELLICVLLSITS